jgi:hypothetical protein
MAWILYGDGLGDFRKTEIVVGHGWHEARLADLDGDGDLDLLNKPYTWETPRVDVWLNNGTSSAKPPGSPAALRSEYPPAVVHDLTPLHDATRVHVNPHNV